MRDTRPFVLALLVSSLAASGALSEASRLSPVNKKKTGPVPGGSEPGARAVPPAVAAKAARKWRTGKERFDQPEEAQRFYVGKRSPDGKTLPVERYLSALEHMQDMPQYSTARGEALPSRRQVKELGAPLPSLLDTWTFLGPGNVGGRTRGLVIHPATPSTMWAAGVAGGIWKSTDSGGSWTPKSDLITNIAVNALAIDPANPLVLYAGTGEGFFNIDAVRGLGIFKTTDGGETWAHLASTANLDFARVTDIVVSPTGGRVYTSTRAGGNGEIWRSTNGGTDWTKVYTAAVTGGVTDLAIRTDATGLASDYIFAAQGNFTQGSILRNTDAAGAGTWDPVFTDASSGRCSLAIAPSAQGTVYALCASIVAGSYEDGLQAVVRSTSNGDTGTWTVRVDNTNGTLLNTLLLSNPAVAVCSGQFFNQGWYDNVIAVDPADPNIVWTGGVDLMRSTDGGATWGLASYWWNQPPSAHADQHTIVFHPSYNGAGNQTMFVGNDGGLFRTDTARGTTSTDVCSFNPGTIAWTSLNNSYGVTQFYHGVPFPGGATYVGGTQDNGTNLGTDGAGINGWTEIIGGDGGYVAVDPTNRSCACGTPCYLFGETTALSIRRSTNCGTSFTTTTSGITESGGNFQFIAPFWMDPTNPARLYIAGRRMWRTANSATSWTQASTTNNFASSVTAIATAPSNADRAVCGDGSGAVYRTTAATTATAGTTWSSSTPRASANVSWLAFDPTNQLVVYATYSTFNGGTTGHVFKSTDGAVTWANLDGAGGTAIPDIPVHSIVIDPANTTHLFVGTDLGVFTSTNGGVDWMVENTGFANVVTEAMTLQGTTLFAFTHGRGAWRVPLTAAPNTAPGITAGGPLARQQGSAGTSSTIATVTDAESGAGSVTVTQIAGGTATGVTISGITNTAGTVTGTVTASCTATTGTVRLQAMDPIGATSTSDLTVNVSANAAPALGTYPATQLNVSTGTTVTPNAVPTDNGTVNTVAASAPGFTGSFVGNPTTGVITVSNAGPAGVHTVTVTATDNCGTTSTTTFGLTVNGAPTIAAGAAATRQQGSPATSATVATVGDDLTAAGSLTVTQIAGGTATGITVSGITNTAGTITANVAASCTATSGTVRFQVMDGGGLTQTADLTVTVTANAGPTQGTYPASTTVNVGTGTTVTPDAAPTDNGSVATVTAAAPGFTGTLTGSSTTGVITVSSAGPAGVYTVTVTATDNCGTTTTKTFGLTVNAAPGLTSSGISRPAGSAAANVAVGTATDDLTAAGSLTVAQVAGGTATGVTLTNLTNTAGAVTADVATTCVATSGTVKIQVTDGNGLSTTVDVTVTITANTAPGLGTYPDTAIAAAAGGLVTPTAPPTDNGSVATVTVTGPTFTGGLSVSSGTGAVTLTNAGPVGAHTITITATDNCGAITTRTFTLTVNSTNSAPLITAGGPLSRARGSSSGSTIATVSDGESAAGSLTVTATLVPAGITVTAIVNTAGTVTATVAASCTATLGANLVTLQVSDGSLTQNATLTVNVTTNTVAPVVTLPSPATVTVNQTTCTPAKGATQNGLVTRFPNQFTDLFNLLNGGSAVDDCTGTPTRLTVQVGGVDVTGTTLFPIGSTPVQLRFSDADGNVGTATVTVVVRRQGDVDANGLIDLNDLIVNANQIVGNIAAGTPPFVTPLLTADLDGDGDVDLFDLVLMANFIVGNSTCELS